MTPAPDLPRRVHTSFRVIVALAAALATATIATLSSSQLPEEPIALRPPPSLSWVCGTPELRAITRGVRPQVAAPDGRPLWFSQEPSILTPNYAGTVSLRNFVVSGDVPTLRFRSSAPVNEGDIETWTRTETQVIGRRLVSVFKPTWGSDALDRLLRTVPWGWDKPSVSWGEVLPGEAQPGQGLPIALRMGPRIIPGSPVVRLTEDVQFSSNVVNLRMPGYGASRLGDDQDNFDAETVSRMFYEHFEDSYDVLAIVPHDDHLAAYAAFHRTVKNQVRGIGEPLIDESARFGSAGRLKAFEVYLNASVTDNGTSSHETAHQWGSYVDWASLTGLVRGGSQLEGHDPLWAPGETLLAGPLEPTRRVALVDSAWQLERTPTLARFHPFTRYAMGILSREDVPEITLFDAQGQFAGDRRPATGTPVGGGSRSATVFNVIGMLGERAGPVPTDWQRATIVVTRDRLLTQAEMDYWTFFARRIEDPKQTGVASWDGIPSFDLSSDRAIDLMTSIRPKAAPSLASSLDVDFPELDGASWRGVAFDAPIKTRYAAGERVRISGHVTALDRNDFSEILLIFSPDDGLPGEALQVRADISSAGTFIVDFQFEPQHGGTHALAAYLFWPGAPGQLPRSSITPIVVEGSASTPEPTPTTPTTDTTITITSSGVSPRSVTVSVGSRVTFVNNDSRAHQMNSNSHPVHTDCPEINQVGFLSAGQSRQTGNLNTARTCGYHDHNQSTNRSLQGTIVIQ